MLVSRALNFEYLQRNFRQIISSTWEETFILDYIVIGAGQSGLAISHYLSQQNCKYLVLDANDKVGRSWLNRWDSLKLFTPSEYNHLPGLPFSFPKGYYPDKHQVAEYLQHYVEHHKMPIKHNQQVTNVEKEGGHFLVASNEEQFKSKHVIVATGPFHTPFIPECHENITEDVNQFHSENYENPAQLKDGSALVVGAGDSGVQILDEISKTNRTVYFSGCDTLKSIPQEFFGKTLWWWFSKIGVLSAHKYSWLGKKLKQGVQPIIGTDVKSVLARDNVRSVGRTLSANETTITFEKANIDSIKNIIWATGYKPNFSWLKGITYDESFYPNNFRGISSDLSGLAFIGLPWTYTRGSATLGA